jgi:hypothetical protein
MWKLEGFLECFDAWADRESPSDDLRVFVTAWIMSRFDDPYRGVRREPGFDNLWFGVVPMSRNDSGAVVTCAYWIEESQHTVRCDSFATLNPPF